MTLENLLSHQFIEDWLSFHARTQLYCYRQKQKLLYNLKDIDMSISPIEKFIILTEDIALQTEIFMGQKGNLFKFICFVKYFFNVFAAHLSLGKSVFKIDMPPSFLLWRIITSEMTIIKPFIFLMIDRIVKQSYVGTF